jgi:hypothetical protein
MGWHTGGLAALCFGCGALAMTSHDGDVAWRWRHMMITSHGDDVTPSKDIFGEEQAGCLVFRSRRAVLTPAECAGVVAICEAHAAANDGWGTVRHSSVHTTDVAVEDIPILRPWLQTLLETCVLLAVHLSTCLHLPFSHLKRWILHIGDSVLTHSAGALSSVGGVAPNPLSPPVSPPPPRCMHPIGG